MDGGLLSLKWNNHRSTLFYMLSTVRKKECYTDVTLACDGKFYSVHKLVLSMCSEYFEQMFEQTQCKHPVIVLKDIKSEELESLLSYMYVGEVNVVQEKLSGLIKAAECLKIKGLAVPDEEPCSKSSTSREKRSSDNSLNSEPKRRRQDDSGNAGSFRQAHSNNRTDDRRKSLDHQSSSTSNKFRNTNSSNSNVNSNRPSSGDRDSDDRGTTALTAERRASPASNNQHRSSAEVKSEEPAETAEPEALEEVVIEEPSQAVKEEPTDADAVYLSDSDSVPEPKDEVLLDSFSDVGQQQHFMDELLGQASESNQGNMGVGDYSEGGEGSSGASNQQQQHMVGMSAEGSYSTTLLPLPPSPAWPTPFTTSVNPEILLGNSYMSSEGNQEHCKRRINSSGTSASFDNFDQHHQVIGNASSSSPLSVTGTAPPSHKDLGASVSSMDYINSIQAHEAKTGIVPMFSQLDLRRLKCSDGRGIACPTCLRLFRDKFNFKDHYMSHSGERPLACHLCLYRCVRKRELERHMMTKHS